MGDDGKSKAELLAEINALRQRVQQLEARSEDDWLGVLLNSVEDAITLQPLLDDGQIGPFAEINDAACAALGYSREELLNLSPEQIAVLFDPAMPAHAEAFKSETRLTLIIWGRVSEGVRVPFEASAYRVTCNGQPMVLTISHNITGRRQAEAALRASEQRFRSVIEQAHEGIALVSEKGQVLVWNHALEQITGIVAGEVLGRYIWDVQYQIMPAEQRTPQLYTYLKTALRKYLATGEAAWANTLMEREYLHPNGERRFLEWRASAIRTERGYLLLNIAQDITGRKQVEQALLHSQADLLRAQSLAHIGSYHWDAQTGVSTWSEELKAILGCEDCPPSYDLIFSRVHPADRAFLQEVTSQKQQGRGPHNFEYRIIRPDGSLRYVRDISEVTYGPDGLPVAMFGTIQDITERKQAEEQIRTALEEKETLLRELNHRTKNNMHVIISMLQLQASFFTDQKARGAFKDMENRLRSMALVHQMLYQSRNLSSISLKNYLIDLAYLLVASYQVPPNQVRLNLEAEDVSVLIDLAIPCGLVVSELISNALKHAFPDGRNGQVRVKLCRNSEGEIIIIISDNGVGVPEGFNFREVNSLGLRTVFVTVEHQLQGKVEFTSRDGLACQVRFKDNLYAKRV